MLRDAFFSSIGALAIIVLWLAGEVQSRLDGNFENLLALRRVGAHPTGHAAGFFCLS
jgi:hypothetical protein